MQLKFPSIRLTDLFITAAALGVTTLYVLAAGGGFPLDDAWIHQTYGRNLALQGEWAFLPGQLSAASTSPLYTVVLALGYALGIPFGLWTHGLGALSLAGTGLIGARLAALISPERRWAPLLTGLALVTAWHLIWAAASGMETMIFSMLTLLLILLSWREIALAASGRAALWRAIGFGVVAGLLVLARPDGMLLVILSGALLLIARLRHDLAGIIHFGLIAGFCFALTLAPYLLYNLSVTGGLLPTTSAAKQAYARPLFELSYLWRLWQMTLPLLAGGQIILIPGMAVYVVDAARRRRKLLYLLPVLWGVGEIALYAAWLPLPFQHGRYVIPALPALIVAGVLGTLELVARSRSSLIPRVLSSVLALSAAAVYAVFLFGFGLSAYRLDVAVIDQEMVSQAHYIRDQLPPDELLVIHDIGAVGYFAPRPLLDIAGLISPEIIPLIDANDVEGMWNLILERDGRYLLAFPDQVPGDDPDDPRLCPLHETPGNAALIAGGMKMTLYMIVPDENCP